MKMEDWKECTLSDLGTILGGATPSTKDSSNYENGSIAWITPKDLSTYTERFISHGERNITEKGLKSCSAQLMPPNSILFTSRAPIGYIAIAKNEVCTNQGFKSIIPNKDTDFMFLYYLLRYNKDNIENLGSGTTFKEVSGSTMRNVPVKVPPLPTQQKIADILSSLDDKIELNNKINTNLEQQAQALFKNWFVDFGPFGGKMSEGWKVGTIGDLCSTISKTYKSNDSHVVLINTSDVENGIILNHESVSNSNLKGQFKKTFQKCDILYSEIRPANKHYAFVDIDTTSNYIASTKLMVIRPNEDINPHYLYHILTNPDLIQEMQHLAETRSGTFPQITFESELSTYQIPLLPKEEQGKLGELFEKIDNQIFHNIKENKMLSTIRDTLLPKVMNGEIEVQNHSTA